MAVTYAFALDPEGRQRAGKQHAVSGTLTLSGTYTTGGDVVPADTFGLGSVETFNVTSAVTNGTESLIGRYLPASGKLQLFWGGGAISSELDEITAADNVGSFACQVEVKGR